MFDNNLIKPFVTLFLQDFTISPNLLPFTDNEIVNLDKELSEYEHVFLDPDVEKNLISKNELLASFGISKAEQSELTLKEAQDVYDIIQNNKEYDFVDKKLKGGKKLTKRDYEKLEFFNIAKTFREINREPFQISDLTTDRIKQIHRSLTMGMDIFKDYFFDFTLYHSGFLRDNDSVRVGDHIPIPHNDIKKALNELIAWLNKNNTILGVATFHATLYAIHPFNNGNKRVCRLLEHILLRSLGLNSKNLYSTSYYYHKEKARYYKNLFATLERKNLNHFTSFILEAIVLSIISVMKTSLETKRNKFLSNQSLDTSIKTILRPLVKRRELQFKHLYSGVVRSKMARQTFVTYLGKAVSEGCLVKREAGRATYYRFNFLSPEEETLRKWLSFANQRLSYIPDYIKLI